jgi:hypothetical protein
MKKAKFREIRDLYMNRPGTKNGRIPVIVQTAGVIGLQYWTEEMIEKKVIVNADGSKSEYQENL